MHHTPSSAENFAIQAHGSQTYGGKPYRTHLEAVVGILQSELRHWSQIDNAVRAGWLHDTIEDTDTTYVDLWTHFGRDVADAVAACSGFGTTRRDRQARIAAAIRLLKSESPEAYRIAVAVKTADRIANVEASAADNARLFKMYLSERETFHEGVARFAPITLQQRLDAAYSKGF